MCVMISKVNRTERIKIQALYVFVFLATCQQITLFNSQYFNLTWIGYFIYLIINLYTYKESFAFTKEINKYLFPIIIYWCLVIVMNYVFYEPDAKLIYAEIRQEFMGIVLMWMMINNIKQDLYKLNNVLNVFVASNLLLVFLYFLNIGVDYNSEGRVNIILNNSNSIAYWFGISIIILINKITMQKNISLYKKFSFVCIIVLFIIIIIKTGSRGGLITFLAGYIVYFLTINKTLKTKIYILIISFFIGVFGFNYIFTQLSAYDKSLVPKI